jgi:hypothetical protein
MIIARSCPSPENINSILVIQLGDIGVAIWTFPTLFALKTAYPQAGGAITFVQHKVIWLDSGWKDGL